MLLPFVFLASALFADPEKEEPVRIDIEKEYARVPAQYFRFGKKRYQIAKGQCVPRPEEMGTFCLVDSKNGFMRFGAGGGGYFHEDFVAFRKGANEFFFAISTYASTESTPSRTSTLLFLEKKGEDWVVPDRRILPPITYAEFTGNSRVDIASLGLEEKNLFSYYLPRFGATVAVTLNTDTISEWIEVRKCNSRDSACRGRLREKFLGPVKYRCLIFDFDVSAGTFALSKGAWSCPKYTRANGGPGNRP